MSPRESESLWGFNERPVARRVCDTFGRWHWAVRTARHADPATLAARLRLLWHDFAIHGLLNRGHERCEDCGRRTWGWRTSDAEWLRVVGSPAGLLCKSCFTAKGGACV